jgi:hypothetical protein
MGSLANASGRRYLNVPTILDDHAQWLRLIAVALNNAISGKLNNTGAVTITANVATTTLTDSRIGKNSMIGLMPTTANAAAALANIYFTTFADGSCVINHANNAQNDRTFIYTVTG